MNINTDTEKAFMLPAISHTGLPFSTITAWLQNV